MRETLAAEKGIEWFGLKWDEQTERLIYPQRVYRIQNRLQRRDLLGDHVAQVQFAYGFLSHFHMIVPGAQMTLIRIKARCEIRDMSVESDAMQGFRTTAIVATLQQCRMFAGLSESDLESVAEGCAVRSLAKGEVLFREGDVADGFYVVRTGAISIQRVTSEGKEQIICVFHANESFAEITLATVETYPADAVALETTQVILVRKREFTALIHRRPELSLRMLGSMSIHLKYLVQMLQDLKGRQVEARLAEWLMKQEKTEADGCPNMVKLGVSKKVLAGQLGVTSETLSRTFARFRDEGLIKVNGPKVEVLDEQGLRAHAQG